MGKPFAKAILAIFPRFQIYPNRFAVQCIDLQLWCTLHHREVLVQGIKWMYLIWSYMYILMIYVYIQTSKHSASIGTCPVTRSCLQVRFTKKKINPIAELKGKNRTSTCSNLLGRQHAIWSELATKVDCRAGTSTSKNTSAEFNQNGR